jgi:hypothetical protein
MHMSRAAEKSQAPYRWGCPTPRFSLYGVKLAGHEVKFVEWQTNGHGRRQPWRKYFCWKVDEDDTPEVLANLEFEELVSALKREGYVDTFAKAGAYCSALKTRVAHDSAQR